MSLEGRTLQAPIGKYTQYFDRSALHHTIKMFWKRGPLKCELKCATKDSIFFLSLIANKEISWHIMLKIIISIL
jgi:hypothetical protein